MLKGREWINGKGGYKEKKELERMVERAKIGKWEELLGELENNPWRKTYEIAVKRMGGIGTRCWRKIGKARK